MERADDDLEFFGPLGAVGVTGVALLLIYVSLAAVLAFLVMFLGSYAHSRLRKKASSREDTPLAVPAIGIDLGTTQSCVAYWSPARDRPKIIKVDGKQLCRQ